MFVHNIFFPQMLVVQHILPCLNTLALSVCSEYHFELQMRQICASDFHLKTIVSGPRNEGYMITLLKIKMLSLAKANLTFSETTCPNVFMICLQLCEWVDNLCYLWVSTSWYSPNYICCSKGKSAERASVKLRSKKRVSNKLYVSFEEG